MRQQIFVVPISSPTMILSLAAMDTPIPENYLIIAPEIHYGSFRRIEFSDCLFYHVHLYRGHLAEDSQRNPALKPDIHQSPRFDGKILHVQTLGLNQACCPNGAFKDLIETLFHVLARKITGIDQEAVICPRGGGEYKALLGNEVWPVLKEKGGQGLMLLDADLHRCRHRRHASGHH